MVWVLVSVSRGELRQGKARERDGETQKIYKVDWSTNLTASLDSEENR